MSSFDFTVYRQLTHFIAGVLGGDSEVVLYSFDDINNSVIELANAGVSGVKHGDQLSSFAIAAMKDKGKTGPPYYLEQTTILKEGKRLRSHHFLILDKRKSPRGMLTVNSDVTKFQAAAELLQRLAYLPQNDQHLATNDGPLKYDLEHLQKTPSELIDSVINDVTKTADIPKNRLRTEEKIKIVERLNKDGFFLIKGAVKQTAASLGSSEATIYRYLAQISGR